MSLTLHKIRHSIKTLTGKEYKLSFKDPGACAKTSKTRILRSIENAFKIMCTLQDSNSIFCLKDYKINHKGTYPMWFFVIFGHQTSIILTGTELEK